MEHLLTVQEAADILRGGKTNAEKYIVSADRQLLEEMSMIDKESFHPLNYIKKEEYSGSMDGMRYMLKKAKSGEEDVIRVTIWPEPLNMIRTPEHLLESIDVPLTEQGVDQAADWLNEQYESRREYWLEKKNRSWTEIAY